MQPTQQTFFRDAVEEHLADLEGVSWRKGFGKGCVRAEDVSS
jgi:hypothetical protein